MGRESSFHVSRRNAARFCSQQLNWTRKTSHGEKQTSHDQRHR
jgi:hypothetical protein